MRVMIVDDEWISVDVLRTEIDWKGHGFQEILCAYNMNAAVVQFQQTEIDLLICDIEMPQGTGLELAEWVRSNSPFTLIIFLTCHDQFSFAQKALQLGSYDYVLKPIVFEQFNVIIGRAVEEIQQSKKQSGELQVLEQYYHLWNNKKADLIEKFWQDLLDDRIMRKRNGIESVLQALAPLAYWSFNVLPILVSIEKWNQDFEQADEEVLEYALRNIAIDLVIEGRNGIAFQDHAGINMILIYLYEGDQVNESSLKEACNTYIEKSKSLLYCDISCYIGWQVPIADLIHPYHALRFEEQKQIKASRQVIQLQFDQHSVKSGDLLLPNFFEWADWIENGNERQLNAAIQEVTGQLRACTEITVAEVQRFKQDMANGLLYSMHQRGHSVALAFENQLEGFINSPTSVAEFKPWIESVIQFVLAYSNNMEQSDTVVHTVQNLIKESLSENLNREDLAAAVFLNPGYLSRLFKKETGYSITDFITHERMKKATEMLRTKATITEIALAVGYSYQSHFSKMFKKTFQMSPQEYRKAIRSSNSSNEVVT